MVGTDLALGQQQVFTLHDSYDLETLTVKSDDAGYESMPDHSDPDLWTQVKR